MEARGTQSLGCHHTFLLQPAPGPHSSDALREACRGHSTVRDRLGTGKILMRGATKHAPSQGLQGSWGGGRAGPYGFLMGSHVSGADSQRPTGQVHYPSSDLGLDPDG